MSFTEQLNDHIKAAMKAKEKERLTLLRSIKAALQNKQIELGSELTPADEVALLLKMIKQRKEAAEGFRKGGAEERAQHEDWEATQLQEFLPPAPSEDEVEAAIDAEIAKLDAAARNPKAMGPIMKTLNEAFAGRPIDGKALSQKIKAKLA
jgi:uncharacterized protein YqeY